MTVIIKYDQENKPQYRSSKGIGSTEIERERARQLDSVLKKSLTSFQHRLTKDKLLDKNTSGNVELYWELGDILRKIFYDSKLIDPSEKHLYWLNARLYVPEELLAKDRSPSRIHLEYCFRLAGFPKDKAIKLNWTDWTDFFDRPGINREIRFDKWLEEKMYEEPNKFSRRDVRTFTIIIHQLLKNKATGDLSDEQIKRCYDVAWLIKEAFIKKFKVPTKELKEALKSSIQKNYTKFGSVIEGNQEPSVLASIVVSEIIIK
jgi:hypothetical protein